MPWSEIAGFRNLLAHDYLGVKVDCVWKVVREGLPQLKQAGQAMLAALPNS